MLNGRDLWSDSSVGHCNDVPNGPENRTAETWQGRNLIHNRLLRLLVRSAVAAPTAGCNGRLLAYRRGERLCVAGHLQYEPAALRGHPLPHKQVKKKNKNRLKSSF